MSQRARLYIGGVIAGGASVVLAAAPRGGWTAREAIMLAGFSAAMIMAERFVIHLPFREQTVSFSLVEIVMTFALFVLPAGSVVLATASGMAGGQLLRRRPLPKAAFNTGMYALAAAAAVGVFTLLRAPELQEMRTYLAALAAMFVFFLGNKLLVSLVVTLVEGQPFLQVIGALAGVIVAIWGGNVALGVLAARLHAADPFALPLLVVPGGLAFAAYRASVRSKIESRRMRDLYAAGSALITSMEAAEDFDPFLECARDLFRATEAEIVLVDDPRTLRVFRDAGPVETIRLTVPLLTERDVIEELDARIRSRDARSSLTAVIAGAGDTTGVLAVYDRRGAEGPEPFPERERDLIRLLADELSIRIRNMRLFRSVSEERAKLADIVDHTTDGIYQTDPDRRIMSWNPAMETITGYTAQEAIGQYCFNILRARDAAAVNLCNGACPILAACNSGSHQDREAEVMTKDGAERWISYSHSPVLDANGSAVSDVVVVRDITEQKRLRDMQEDFTSTISHELRTPLTPLKGFLLTLLRSNGQLDPAEVTIFHERMLHQTERLERLVDDLLEVARLKSSGTNVSLSAVNVDVVVEQMVKDFRAAHPHREFDVRLDPPGRVALADGYRLEQVLGNLLQNAVRYSPDHERIEVVAEQRGDEVLIAVRDYGAGIAKHEQRRVFERFYRSGDHLTRPGEGLGVGLYIARSLAQAMGGRIELDSALGRGSTFTVHLPTDDRRRYQRPPHLAGGGVRN
ncbi:MAG TPA: ATP-binding protein [Actinomycetota bacterium]